jgi:tetratricopeptide (TPR) repeat protein
VAWEKLDNFYELANAHQALGNLENKRKQPEQALEWLQKALELCMKTPPSNQRTWLEGHIRATIDEIPW